MKHGIDDRPFNAAHELMDGHVSGPTADEVAIIGPREMWTFRDLALRSGNCATAISQDLGLSPGSAVILHCTNSAWLAAVILGLWRAGCVAVMCAPLLSEEEVFSIQCKTAAKAWITDTDNLHYQRNDVQRLDHFVELAQSRVSTQRHDDWVRTAPTDPALILFTSGTTGKPKATLHFHRDLVVAPLTYGRQITSLRPGDVVAGSAALSFAYGLETLLLMPLHAGAATIMSGNMAAAEILAALRQWPITHLFTTPFIIAALLEQDMASHHQQLRMCISAGENLTADLMARWQTVTGTSIASGLGLTEFNAFILGSAPGQTLDGSLGHVVEGFKARLLDDAGHEVDSHEIGRLAVRGPTGCRYLDAPDEQAQRVVDGWTLTGDLCERDGQGNFWYRGRSDDLIVRAGINIAPAEIEHALIRSPLVRECAVVGRFDEVYQTRMIYAYIVFGEVAPADVAIAQRELRHWAARRLPPHKLPDLFVPVDRLPRNRNGKLDRLSLMEQGYDVAACNYVGR